VVAVVGSYFVQTEDLHWEAFALSVPVGLLAAAILLVNNIRDADTDRRAGKRTLAVRLGRGGARGLFVACIALAYLMVPVIAIFGRGISALVLLALLSLPLAVPLIRVVRERTDGPSLNEALARTGMLLALFSLLLSVGLLAS
jgi:1,4-dihydroxy-2-naphthoate octaprenyltransferase